jgi:hypothetical protein
MSSGAFSAECFRGSRFYVTGESPSLKPPFRPYPPTLSPRLPRLRNLLQSAVAYAPGKGITAILPDMTQKGRRVRWLSARSSQW